MPLEWRVTYEIDPPVQVDPKPPRVEELNLELVYWEGAVRRAVHTVRSLDGDSRGALEQSKGDLLAYWLAVEHRVGKPMTARIVHAQASNGDIVSMLRVPMKAPAVGKPLLPDAARVIAAGPRLAPRLTLANLARDDRDDASSLRTYYMILEDIRGRPDASDPRFQEVAWARNFVSHAKVDHAATVAFLARELGWSATEYRYDPHDIGHRKLVHKFRRIAAAEVEGELAQYL